MSKYIKLYDAIMAMDEWFSEPITPTKILSNLPTIEVSEDCISREELLKDFGLSEKSRKYGGDHSGYQTLMLYEIQDIIENAPSVVPTCQKKRQVERAEGEWIPCTKEGLPLTELMRREGKKWYGYRCTNCNFVYKGNAITESRYCQGCGAKMKG